MPRWTAVLCTNKEFKYRYFLDIQYILKSYYVKRVTTYFLDIQLIPANFGYIINKFSSFFHIRYICNKNCTVFKTKTVPART